MDSHPVPIPEVRARRLVVTDKAGRDRIVAEVVDDVAQLRLALPDCPAGRSTDVICFARSDGIEGPTIGIQLWGDGNAVIEIDAWRENSTWVGRMRVGDDDVAPE